MLKQLMIFIAGTLLVTFALLTGFPQAGFMGIAKITFPLFGFIFVAMKYTEYKRIKSHQKRFKELYPNGVD
jgi:type III secretory pathway component EscV